MGAWAASRPTIRVPGAPRPRRRWRPASPRPASSSAAPDTRSPADPILPTGIRWRTVAEMARMADKPPIRIVVGEDQPIVREGVIRVLENAGFEVVGAATDADDLVRKAGAHKPDVVVTDIQMPPTSTDDGLQAANHIRSEQSGIGILVLSQYLEGRYALELVSEGADGV